MTTTDSRTSHSPRATHGEDAGPGPGNRIGQLHGDTQPVVADPVSTSLRANGVLTPNGVPPAGTSLPAVQRTVDALTTSDGGNHTSPLATRGSLPNAAAPDGDPTPEQAKTEAKPGIRTPAQDSKDGGAATIGDTTPKSGLSLADPFLALAADVLDDTEATKIANENRLRQLTRTAVDSDGEERGFGLDESHPDVANLAALVALLGQVEHQAVLQLQRKMRKHPLGPWIKSQKGVGDKQAARLLAVIGDPYWNDLHARPRTVSELWAYCGLHVIPASHWEPDTQKKRAGGDSSPAGGDSSQGLVDTQTVRAGVAARRQKGQKANWSTTAKTRAYLIAESMLRAGNREVYDKRKTATEGRLHSSPCVRCGPKGKPAQPGSPWSDGHRHADALRIQSKELLKGLWREAKRLHEEH